MNLKCFTVVADDHYRYHQKTFLAFKITLKCFTVETEDHSATFIFVIFLYVIASIAYIHPVYGAGVRTHDLLIVSRLP